MATCKDCFHFDACVSILRKTFPKASGEINKPNCSHFAEDVREVVHCKDCKHYYEGIMNRCTHPCGLKQAGEFDWCCWGERK